MRAAAELRSTRRGILPARGVELSSGGLPLGALGDARLRLLAQQSQAHIGVDQCVASAFDGGILGEGCGSNLGLLSTNGHDLGRRGENLGIGDAGPGVETFDIRDRGLKFDIERDEFARRLDSCDDLRDRSLMIGMCAAKGVDCIGKLGRGFDVPPGFDGGTAQFGLGKVDLPRSRVDGSPVNSGARVGDRCPAERDNACHGHREEVGR